MQPSSIPTDESDRRQVLRRLGDLGTLPEERFEQMPRIASALPLTRMTAPRRVMHVDDDPDIREVARMTLEAIGGFTVLTCASGQELLDRISGFAPDLVLLDAMMPHLDGPAALRRLRALPVVGETPVIFMTARVQARETRQYLGMGAAGVITKPFDPLILCDEIRKIWQRPLGFPGDGRADFSPEPGGCGVQGA